MRESRFLFKFYLFSKQYTLKKLFSKLSTLEKYLKLFSKEYTWEKPFSKQSTLEKCLKSNYERIKGFYSSFINFPNNLRWKSAKNLIMRESRAFNQVLLIFQTIYVGKAIFQTIYVGKVPKI